MRNKIILLSAILLGLISFQAVYAEDATSPNPMLTPSAPMQPESGIPAQNPSDAGAINPTDNTAATTNPSDNSAATQPPAAPGEGPVSDAAPTTDADMSIAGVNDEKSGTIDPSATINSEPDAPVDAD